MTSFIVEAHVGRVVRPEWAGDPQCAFCSILQKKLPAYILYEDEKVISILGWSPSNVRSKLLKVGKDIAPLRLGHTLVIPKIHLKHISELPEDYAAALGLAVTRVAKALTKCSVTGKTSRQRFLLTCITVLENPGLNVVGNQEYAQAVPHVGV
jgi:hypothetical protein